MPPLGGMGKGAELYADLVKAIKDARYKPRLMRTCVVLAELKERAKPRRDLTQEQIAAIFMIDARTLRTWTARYLAEGVDGLRARGGQGRKPALSDEEISAAIKRAEEQGGFHSTPEKEAGKCGACKEAVEAKEAKEAGEKRPRRKAPAPAKCKCGDGGCIKPGKCKCAPGRACKCRCCRSLKLPPRGPRHARGCPLARILPKGALTAAILGAVLFDMFGVAYSTGHLYDIMARHNLVSKKLSSIHINHAGCAAVRAWQRRLAVRLKKLRDAGYAICSFDECFMVRDKSTGRMWVEKGKKVVQLYTGSHERIALFGYYFEDCTHRFQEYAFADAFALIDSLRRIGAEYGRVAVIMDRMSAHQAEVLKKFLRDYRRANPGRDIQLIFLPRGSPYLNVVEECWGLLKKAVAHHYYYLRFDDFRWAVSDYLRTARYTMRMEDFLYRNPRLHLPAK